MRRLTLIAASIVSMLVIGYGGWLSSAETGSGSGGDGTSQTGKPGEAPKP
jgi:hypothetical protein